MKNLKNQFDINFASHWDQLVDWEKRKNADNGFISKILTSFNSQHILDVATGTGFDSINLIKSGFNVTSLDGSLEMLEIANKNATIHGVKLNAINSLWGEYNGNKNNFDAIICLGNSLACATKNHDRINAVNEWYGLLKKKGILIIDHRNYDAILRGEKVPLTNLYYLGGTVQIKTELINETMTTFKYIFKDGSQFDLNMFPLRKAELFNYFLDAGFTHLITYGDNKEEYLENTVGFFQHVFIKK